MFVLRKREREIDIVMCVCVSLLSDALVPEEGAEAHAVDAPVAREEGGRHRRLLENTFFKRERDL